MCGGLSLIRMKGRKPESHSIQQTSERYYFRNVFPRTVCEYFPFPFLLVLFPCSRSFLPVSPPSDENPRETRAKEKREREEEKKKKKKGGGGGGAFTVRQESKKWCVTRWGGSWYCYLLSVIFCQLRAVCCLLCLWKVYFTRATKTEIVQLLTV